MNQDFPQIPKVRTRFAPSPTGFLHIGSLRTALFGYLFAKKNNGKFILRIEDTDQARFVEGAIESLIRILERMGLNYDEGVTVDNSKISDRGEFGPYLQSRRKGIYKKYAGELVAGKHAYYCFCNEKRLEELRKEQEALKQPTMYDRKCRNLSSEDITTKLNQGLPFAVRQAIPESGQTVLKDLVFKEIVWDNKLLDDQVLLKSDGFPTYHLAVVVDDHLMEISHVIRGEEWLPSTPKHLLLYKSFGWTAPEFAHLPLILNKDRSKLSKRQNDVAVEDYLNKGYLEHALINFIALLGWNPKTDQEIFTIEELTAQFDFAKVNKAGAVFDVEKLDWVNGTYIRKMDLVTLINKIIPYLEAAELIKKDFDGNYFYRNGKSISFEMIGEIVALEKERLKKLSDISPRVLYFFEKPIYPPQLLIWRKANLDQTKMALTSIYAFLNDLPEVSFTERKALEEQTKNFIKNNGLDNGTILWPLRVALSGLEASPNPFEIIEVLFKLNGKEEILQRVTKALEILE